LAIRSVIAIPHLPALESGTAESSPPKVSIIVAVRDEAARIEKTIRQIMPQEGIDLDLIIVDDRSTDGTTAILQALKQDFSSLRVIRIDQLPENWLGKCHAMHIGGQAARGDWLLFMDGDVWLKPLVVARAVSAAASCGADHFTLLPSLHSTTQLSPGFQSCMLIFHILFSVEMARANMDKKNAMNGVGAFNLIRRDAYTAIGGHTSLRLEVADDMKLGLLVGRSGRRSRVCHGDGQLEADWASTIWGIVKALEKNCFSGVNYSVVRLMLIMILFFGMWLGSIGGLFAGILARQWIGFAAAGAMGLFVVAAVKQACRVGWPILAGLLTPLFMPIVPLVFCNSAIKSLRQGGIRWRDTFYPLPLLRQHLIRTDRSGPFSI
jgi:glycosyltransferase involved in cell wall biosynthesis